MPINCAISFPFVSCFRILFDIFLRDFFILPLLKEAHSFDNIYFAFSLFLMLPVVAAMLMVVFCLSDFANFANV